MRSFFTRIQNKFSSSFGGRYVETILKEISKNDTFIIKHLFPTVKEEGILELEYNFISNGNDRIADIALISTTTGKLLALAEIKYDDHNNPKNAAQLEDYIDFCKETNIQFVYLTQYYPSSDDINYLKESHFTHILFSEYAFKILNKNTSELSRLFVDYIRDKGLMMEKIKTDHIGKFLVRLFNPYKGQRVQCNIDMIQNIPETFSSLMTNINVISQEISQYLIKNRTPTIDFFLNPTFKLSKKTIKNLSDEKSKGKVNFIPEENDRNGGELYIFARSNLKNKHAEHDWFWIEFGFAFSIEKNTKEYTTNLYCTIKGQATTTDHYISKNIGNSIVSNKEKCIKYTKKLISEALTSVISDSGIKNIHKKQLESIKENINQ